MQRMLKDPKIGRLVENFGGQWLQFRALEAHRPDFYKFPLWDNYLRMSAEQETRLFFENLIREDRSILEFLDADYTFVNQYLAEFYGLDGVEGPGVPARQPRGYAAPRRAGAGERAHIVVVSRSHVGRASRQVDSRESAERAAASGAAERARTSRTRRSASTPRCGSAWKRIARTRCARRATRRWIPLGFGLENFDAIGSWREKEGPTPIDATGVLPDGKTFNGPVELVGVLRSQRDAFAQGLSERMLTYALGRGVETSDRPAVRKIAAGIAAADYRFSSVVLQIVNSLPFQMRKAR